MATITFKGNPIHTSGNLPATGSKAPSVTLTSSDLSDFTLEKYTGKKILLNIFPSLDTSVCATSVRKFNEKASSKKDTVVICVSKDLPFAHKRFCTTEGLEQVISASEFRYDSFGKGFGVTIQDGALAGLFSRAVVVIDEKGVVKYTEQVPEIAQEPDYEKALAAL